MPVQSGLNSLEYRTELANELDKKLVQESVTARFEDPKFKAKFVGSKTVLIPDVEFSGLGDYDRESGFPQGAVSIEHTPYVLTQDRAQSFNIDREDMDEIGIAQLSSNVMSEFVRTKAVPEMDAYNLSKLAAKAIELGQTEEISANKSIADGCFGLLNALINNVCDAQKSYSTELIAFVNPTVKAALDSTPELNRRLEVVDFKNGEVHTRLKKLDNCLIVPASAATMKSQFTFNSGEENNFGFSPAEGAQNVGIIVVPVSVPKLVKKTEKVKIFEPDNNQKLDAYTFQYRLYYDLFVKKSDLGTIHCYKY